MIARRTIVVAIVAAVLLLWLGWASLRTMYLAPRADLEDKIARARANVEGFTGALAGAERLRGKVDAIVARTLGDDREQVDHRLRTRLNRIAEGLALDAVTVTTGGIASRRTPARSRFRGSFRGLADEPDFVELDGRIAAEGSLEQVLRLLQQIEAEPWIKRIDQLRIDPKAGGERCAVGIRLTTLYIAGRAPASITPLAPAPSFDRYASMAALNPFRLPRPAPAGGGAAAAAPPAPAAFPWGQWALTGIAAGPGGPEAWVINRKTGESRRLVVGESLSEAELSSADGDRAEFRLGEERFIVVVGTTFRDRLPIK